MSKQSRAKARHRDKKRKENEAKRIRTKAEALKPYIPYGPDGASPWQEIEREASYNNGIQQSSFQSDRSRVVEYWNEQGFYVDYNERGVFYTDDPRSAESREEKARRTLEKTVKRRNTMGDALARLGIAQMPRLGYTEQARLPAGKT